MAANVENPSPNVAVRRLGQAPGSAAALALTEAAAAAPGPVVVVTGTPTRADQIAAELAFFAPDSLPVLPFPDAETLPYDAFSPHPEITSRRLETLYRLTTADRGLIVAPIASLTAFLAPPQWLTGSSLMVRRGEWIDREVFRQQLSAAGYVHVPQVTEHGEFSLRGSLIDIYPMGSGRPYRLDLFDEDIETLRTFDPESQRSGHELDEIRLLPGREFPFDAEAIKAFRRRFRAAFPGDLSRMSVYRDVSEGIAPGGIEGYLPLFFDTTATFFDYLPATASLCFLEDPGPPVAAAWQSAVERHEQLAHNIERPILEPNRLFLDPAAFEAAAGGFPELSLEPFRIPDEAAGTNFGAAQLPPVRLETRGENPRQKLDTFLENFGGRVLFTAESAGRREMLRELLGAAPATVSGWAAFCEGEQTPAVAVAPLETGFVLRDRGLAVIPESALLGDRPRQARRRRKTERDPDTLIRALTDLSLGAAVVHHEHGVGRYLGLCTLEAGGQKGEFLTLEYAGGDKLYVPVQSLDLISRYTGASPESAPLHKLGSDQWARARKRAASRVRDVAAELLDIHARRAARPGHAFQLDPRDYAAFCEAFPFEETADQRAAIAAVVGDMTQGRPMDRVVCGDVGFGKTEVAMRAAFVAANAGKQVAVLVPTTLLAQQHFQNFSDRFADWPVRVELLSRFRSRKEVDRVLGGMADGTVDIVIGTHKLLGRDINFAGLGLLIVDEEHRFGVRDKERLKALRADVDMLTLTATPIPRTLNMAMGGLRDLSLITTPPEDRLAVKTFVTEWNPGLVREAFLREIRRGGQVYFLHNQVESIERTAAALEELVPESRVRIAHGQMRERELEQIMLDFYHRRFNVLVCTTIIESGIDVPTANTIVINRADKLGLAQLHQLRGRVGRSHHRAYAYMVTPPAKAMTPDAVKRLEAIESLEDLGAGFMLATHDLEIRGAGELLGQEQSGQIQEIGFSLYMDMLQRAVSALQSGREPALDAPLDPGVEVEMGTVALLPEDYVPDVHMRLVLYKRIAAAEDAESLRELQVELIDRFGLLPGPARQLFMVSEIRQRARRLGIRRLDANAAGGRVQFSSDTRVEPEALIRLIQGDPRRFRLDGQSLLRFSEDLEPEDRRYAFVHGMLDRLAEAA